MSNRYDAAELLAELADEEAEVTRVVAGIRLLPTIGRVDETATELAELMGDPSIENRLGALLYSLRESGVISSEGHVDEARLRDVTGAARALMDRGPKPKNTVVVNLPVGEHDEIGQSLGSLVVRLMELIGRAEKEIVILNPFFTSQVFGHIAGPLASATHRGVELTIITRSLTYESNNYNQEFVRRLNEELDEDAAMTLFEYIGPAEEGSATIHAKMTLVDDREAYLGTANLTHRGLRDNLEIGVIFQDDTVYHLSEFVGSLRGSKFLYEVRYDGSTFIRI